MPARSSAARVPLSRDRVLDAAMAVADAGGLDALTIRSLAGQLGTKPMSVYHHVAGKDEILDGIVDLVFAEIDLPAMDGDWRAGMISRANSARRALGRHPWAIALLQSRAHPGPATLRHHDAVIGALRAGGFSVAQVAHAFALIDSYVFGFALSEAALPIHGPRPVAEVAGSMMAQHLSLQDHPHLLEFTTEHVMLPGYSFGDEFAIGLDVILDGLTELIGRRPG